VALVPGFQLKTYRVVAVNQFPVTDAAIKDAEDRQLAQSLSVFLQSELVRRLRESGLFERVINLGETPMPAGVAQALRIDGDIPAPGPGLPGRAGVHGSLRGGPHACPGGDAIRGDHDRQGHDAHRGRRVASMGFFGGDSKDHLRESFDDTARDLAKFLIRLSRGEAPRP
jgi:hypothetical protein